MNIFPYLCLIKRNNNFAYMKNNNRNTNAFLKKENTWTKYTYSGIQSATNGIYYIHILMPFATYTQYYTYVDWLVTRNLGANPNI